MAASLVVMTPFLAAITPFPVNCEINEGHKNGTDPPFCPFCPVSLTLFLVNILSNHPASKFPNSTRNTPSCLLNSCFMVSISPSVNPPGFSSDLMILII